MFFMLFLLFTTVPLVELILLLHLGRLLGVWPTIGIVVVTGLAGAFLVRLAGATVLRKIREQIRQGKLPTDGLIEGALVLFGGALLLTPGVLTDLIGLSLLFPPSRVLYRHWLKTRLKTRFKLDVRSPVSPSMPGQDWRDIDVDIK